MVTAQFGEKSWEEESASGGNRGSDFFNMKEDGQYVMRICGKPYEFAAHWVDVGGKRMRLNCAGKDCVLCAAKQKPSVRYFIPVIVRSGPGVNEQIANTCKITEFGPQVYGHIRSLYKSPAWGNPMGYDIMIDKNKSRGASGTYFVTPGGEKRDFTAEESAEIKEFLQRINLVDMSAPLENQEIMEKLGPAGCSSLGITGTVSTAGATPATEFDFNAASTEQEFDFSQA